MLPITVPAKNIISTIGSNVYKSNQNSPLLLKYKSKGANTNNRKRLALNILAPVESSRNPENWLVFTRLAISAKQSIKMITETVYK